MVKYSNASAVPLSLAVFLATDTYDHNDDPYTISATTLLKPVRQIVLSSRVPDSASITDLSQMIPSRIGSAIHDSIEQAWKGNYQRAMASLGYPKKVIERVLINPEPEQLTEEVIPIYLEQRLSKQVGQWNVTGKFDFIGDGRVEDFKSTSVYTIINGTNDDKYIQQGSIYRWLDPKKITKDEMAIQFLFMDWSKAKAMSDPSYPQNRFQQKLYPLQSIQETDAAIRRKLSDIEKYWDAPEEQIPLCSDADLWRSEPVWKYYKNPQKMSRSTKNFTTKQEAFIRMAEDNNVGRVVEHPGQVTACRYCSAFPVCTQKDQLIASGDLQL